MFGNPPLPKTGSYQSIADACSCDLLEYPPLTNPASGVANFCLLTSTGNRQNEWSNNNSKQ